MASDLLIRRLNAEDKAWLDETRPPGMSQAEYLRSIIHAFRTSNEDPQASLFDIGVEPERVYSSLPFTFIDLFAGIGGFRSALTALGGTCVYTNEWDKFAAATYEAWYGDAVDRRDIRTIDFGAEIPNHDILAAGFPCQPFSLAGVSKKNSLGRAHGFDDEKQGNLFFSLLDAIDAKRPPVLFLENVKNLKSHDKGNTWKVIHASLVDRDTTSSKRLSMQPDGFLSTGNESSSSGSMRTFSGPESPSISHFLTRRPLDLPSARYSNGSPTRDTCSQTDSGSICRGMRLSTRRRGMDLDMASQIQKGCRER